MTTFINELVKGIYIYSPSLFPTPSIIISKSNLPIGYKHITEYVSWFDFTTTLRKKNVWNLSPELFGNCPVYLQNVWKMSGIMKKYGVQNFLKSRICSDMKNSGQFQIDKTGQILDNLTNSGS
uniref:Uncharacterized protein n=1 Tax=Rhizophagus irregularis (strain DAOM 181602 / DAOM 197198 / MUCL 43194) TaxID=747089 RepID=U9TM19_RHIID